MSEKREPIPMAIHVEEYFHHDEDGNRLPRCFWIDVRTPTGTCGTLHVENDTELAGLAYALIQVCKEKGIIGRDADDAKDSTVCIN